MKGVPTFSARFVKVVGEEEQLEFAVAANTPEELKANLTHVYAQAQERLMFNNVRALEAGENLRRLKLDETLRKAAEHGIAEAQALIAERGGNGGSDGAADGSPNAPADS